MIEFEKIDVNNIPNSFKFIKKYKCEDNDHYYFISTKTHLIIIDHIDLPLKSGKRLVNSYQLEIPKAGLNYFIDSVSRFFLHEDEGGVPFGKMSVHDAIDGETIQVFRAHSADQYGGGYALITLDREEDEIPQKLIFSDHELFECGLMDVLKEIAKELGAE